jgi:replicative DNA helicase
VGVSIVELPDTSSGSLMRTPPQDLAAEQSVLGGMLLSKDAIADVVEVVRGHDFYRPAHELVFEAVLDLYGRGEPADAVTVSAELQKRGELGRVGGAPYIHTLLQSVPTAANAGYYARIVRETAVLRRLIEAGTKIVQLGYTGDGDADDIVDAAQAEVYAVTDKRTSEDYLPLSAIMEGALDEIEAIGSRGGEMVGVPTGFVDLDELTNGLHPGQMVVVAARPAVGKALALDTPLPTPAGWTTMGEVAVGDRLVGADGLPTTVTAATEVMTGRPCYEVEFADGTVVVADGQHGWLTESRTDGRAAVRTTREVARTLWDGDGDQIVPNHSVRTARPLQLPERELPLPPYALGARLADGWARRPAGDELQMRVEAALDGRSLDPVEPHRLVGPDRVPAAGRVPPAYLRASEAQRRDLLAGVLDRAGEVTARGCLRLVALPAEVATDLGALVTGLGYQCSATSDPDGTGTLVFCADDDMFRVEDLRQAHKEARAHRDTDSRRVVVDVRRVPSVPVRCVEVDNADHLYLAGRAMVPTHNSTLGLDIARAAAIKANMATCVFSLEMSRNEITMRLLSAEARVPLHHMRTGKLTDDDWTRLARRMGEVSNAPLFIDDSPNMSMMEIRAKCRRLKQRHDLKLVIIDYLQLMQSGKRVESRQQEVSEFSRAIKLLAKELEVPVIAISQLNRGSEQRTDKKPQMSDLRESGCLPASTRVLRADTGAEVTMGELFASGARDVPVWSLDDSLRYRARTMTHVFPTGEREVFTVTLASGKQVRATASHPFLTYDGWAPIGGLAAGARVAVPRHVPGPLADGAGWVDAQVTMLAHLIGDGSFVRRQPIRYASVDEENLAAVTEAAKFFGVTAVRDDYPAARCTTLRLPAPWRLGRGRRNPIAAWLDGFGLFGARSHEKFVPDAVFGLPKRQISLFLRHLWSTDGSVTVLRSGRGGRIYYASTSRRLVDDVSRLLLRFGISCRVRSTTKAGYRTGWTLDVSGADDQRRFLREIGVHGARAVNAARLLDIVTGTTGNPNVDTVPVDVWSRVRAALVEQKVTHRQFAAALGTQFCGSAMWKHARGRERLGRVAALLGDADLEMLATNDVLWDTVVSIESAGVEAVFDATVLGTHNFVADGVAVHNSIEQDADMVVLLHREEMYERESPRAGEADFIVAKHRNGPTATITVAFQGHYSRFVDMAQS